MRVALCLSGQPRSVEAGFEYHKKNILDRYPVDVFYHTWGADVSVLKPIDMLYQPKMNTFTIPFKDNGFFKKYDRVASPQHPALHTYSMFYSIYRANQLKTVFEIQNGFRYDCVIRSRFDFAINKEFKYDQMVSKNFKINDAVTGDQCVFVPADRMTDNHDFCADMFAFGTSDVMNRYSNTINNIDIFYDRLGTVMNGEEMLSANLFIYGLTGDRMVYVPMNNPFPPGKYNGNMHSIIRDDFTQFNKLRG